MFKSKVKNSQRCYFAWENLRWGFCVVVIFSFVDVLHFAVVLLIAFRHHPSSVDYHRGFYTPFYTFSPVHRRVIRNTFVCSTIPFLPRVLRPWVSIFYQQTFFTLRSFRTFLAQPAFIKASLGAGSYSLKFSGLHTDPRNRDPLRLFVWFTVIHNLLHILNLYLYMSILQTFLLVLKTLIKNLDQQPHYSAATKT